MKILREIAVKRDVAFLLQSGAAGLNNRWQKSGFEITLRIKKNLSFSSSFTKNEQLLQKNRHTTAD